MATAANPTRADFEAMLNEQLGGAGGDSELLPRPCSTSKREYTTESVAAVDHRFGEPIASSPRAKTLTDATPG